MSVEVAVLVGTNGKPLYWHLPPDATAALIPDSSKMWDKIWQHKNELLGIAHTHPGGLAEPSSEDLSTFSATEVGLADCLLWWVVTQDDVTCWEWNDEFQIYSEHAFGINFVIPWLEELRLLSVDEGARRRKRIAKPSPHIIYNWDDVYHWLLQTGTVSKEEMSSFETYVSLTREFGMDRGFQLSDEDLEEQVWRGGGLFKKYNGTTIPTKQQVVVIQSILEHFNYGETTGERFVEFSGRR